jgi:hypothetical protein
LPGTRNSTSLPAPTSLRTASLPPKIVPDRHLPAWTFEAFKWVAIAAVGYCLWAVVGGDPPTVVNAMVALLLSVPLYPFFISSMEAATRRKQGRRASPATETAA